MSVLKHLEQPPTLADIRKTREAIAPMIHRTPVMTCAGLDALSGKHLFFKCENFQKVGAFKMRGAASAARRLSPQETARGLATHSSGNHAQAVARAAQLLGVPAYIVMPAGAPDIKKRATRSYGAEIILCGNTVKDREDTLEEVVDRTGATFIHPYNNYDVIAGQATAALELIEDAGPFDTLIAPVGGGGLMSGTALTCRALLPGAKVLGAEPAAVDDAFRSMRSGKIEGNEHTETVADGLRTTLGPKTFGIIREQVDEILTVSERQIVEAMRLVWERMKIIIEPSCAVPLAAVMAHPDRLAGERIGIILTGGNVDLDRLPFADYPPEGL